LKRFYLNTALLTGKQRQHIPLKRAGTRQTKWRYITERRYDNLKSRSSKFFHIEVTYTRTGGLADMSTPTAPHTELRNNGTSP
jgi:hypothetical protein